MLEHWSHQNKGFDHIHEVTFQCFVSFEPIKNAGWNWNSEPPHLLLLLNSVLFWFAKTIHSVGGMHSSFLWWTPGSKLPLTQRSPSSSPLQLQTTRYHILIVPSHFLVDCVCKLVSSSFSIMLWLYPSYSSMKKKTLVVRTVFFSGAAVESFPVFLFPSSLSISLTAKGCTNPKA